jgi:membrane protease YdiL (CAAX protease family)
MIEFHPSLLVVLLWGSIVEEAVFRSLLPRRCLAILRNRCTPSWVEAGAFIAPQVLFAASHVLGNTLESPFSSFSATEFTRLVAAGLMLQVVQLLFGIGAAIGAHASINAVLLLESGVGVGSPELATTLPLLVFGLLLLSAVIHTEPRRAAAHKPT